ncbi:hypothetical protein [Bosea sp. BH3]|uniref:hypothetical protein n=1 Tax=Bosea sp. BH3 TaxID=2871701 RepID=UPI0021CB50CC|nr:hypothetical protein [Bosea sp. BH3]MCU4180627.1 hypothetical protein [Bosea sp. BH3]
MTITAYGTGAYRAAKPNNFVSSRAELDDLQRQLDTQQRATSYGDLGIDRRVSLDVNGKLSSINSWLDGIGLADVSLKLLTSSVENFAKLTNGTRADASADGYMETSTGQSPPQILAQEKLKQTLDLLDSSVNGRYLFSGKTSDKQPTATFNEIMDGDGAGKAGVKQLIDERQQADLGSGLGRLSATVAAATVTVAEEAVAHPYGFKISGATSSSAAITTTLTAGPPASLAVDVATLPAAGDKVTFKLTLPDGTQEEIVLTARAADTEPLMPNTFEIGADVNATAANLQVAITEALGKEARSSLSAASAQVAAQNFFAGSNSNPPLRVPGPPYASATLPPTNTGAYATSTVIWYRGEDGTDPARSTATVQVDQAQTVQMGARANEEAFRIGLAQFAIMATETFPASDTESKVRYQAMTDRVSERLGYGGTVQKPTEIVTDLASAQTAMASAKERHTTTKSYLTTALEGVENVKPEEVAMQILALQNRLQASYEVTSTLSRLSLTNYL